MYLRSSENSSVATKSPVNGAGGSKHLFNALLELLEDFIDRLLDPLRSFVLSS